MEKKHNVAKRKCCKMKRKKEVGKGNKLQGKNKFDKIRMSLRAQKSIVKIKCQDVQLKSQHFERE